MKKSFLFLAVFSLLTIEIYGADFCVIENRLKLSLDDGKVITTPKEGLWSIATDWTNDWMSGWKHVQPQSVTHTGEWTQLHGTLALPEGNMLLRDSYRMLPDGKLHCVRRFEWQGPDTLKKTSLSIRFQMHGKNLKPLLPGILYYGNKMGAKINPEIIPVYNSSSGEFAIFEEHRFPMPFVMLENAEQQYAAAVHSTPSPVRGAVINDQWWAMGVEAYDGYTEFVLYSGPVG
ncbi:MAG: hypothetical protein LBU34_16980, partial [Planctomycetaceae bacterium]|nr:hypothetical protein [Planctomycetaceae bacterium]